MNPHPLLGTSRLPGGVAARPTDLVGAAMAVTKPARTAAGFIQQHNSNFMDCACAVGCATFSMGVIVGVYFLLDNL